MDFYKVNTVYRKDGSVVISPMFLIGPVKDLMIKGRDFYAAWLEDEKRWTTSQFDVYRRIDNDIVKAYDEAKERYPAANIVAKYMSDSSSGSVDAWRKYCTKQMCDSYTPLDSKLIFADQELTRDDYCTHKLPYSLSDAPTPAWDELIGGLYDEENKHKIEWCIGSIVTGASKKLQKFLVFYGAAGTGKSTVINIIQDLFDGYWNSFNAQSLGSKSDSFALEPFKNNPLVAIQHDGDLSKIEDNTRLNSLVSHETMSVNEKFKGLYEMKFVSFLVMGTNSPVRITDANSGIIRRLIDVQPKGTKIPNDRYNELNDAVKFEHGAIANKCANVYLENPKYYNGYTPIAMISKTNAVYDFLMENYDKFANDPDGDFPLVQLWTMYKQYVEDSGIPYPLTKQKFKSEMEEYFRTFTPVGGGRNKQKNIYSGFKAEKFEFYGNAPVEDQPESKYTIEFEEQHSLLDDILADMPAQYTNDKGTPIQKWENVTTTLSDIDTSKLHYVKVPLNHIVIDFDIKNENGEKDFEKNLAEASKFPPTYAELSKSGAGIHLHYIYDGDVTKLANMIKDEVEVKVYSGNSSLRRQLTRCNNLEVAHISGGLPFKKEEAKMVSSDVIRSEKGLRRMIERNLAKEIHPGTKPSIDFIFTVLEDAYNRGLEYDVSDMRPQIVAFAAKSTHQSAYCLKKVKEMKFKSEDKEISTDRAGFDENAPISFFDLEVYPNLLLVCYKFQGKDFIYDMINPSPDEVKNILGQKLIGFNNREYDNHILYARMMGYDNQQIFELSKNLINTGKKDANKKTFREAYNLSYSDIYDFASAGNKKGLKKFEIELGIHHEEMELPWDQPVPEELLPKVIEYCHNDVVATEATFEYLSADWTARLILADIADGTPNDTTNTLTKKIIFGDNRHPQSEFRYRNLAEPVYDLTEDEHAFLQETFPEMACTTHGEAGSQLPYFPGYKYENGVSTYKGEEVGEGGYVYAEEGIYGNVALLDITSMHPHSLMTEILFGVRYTRIFHDIVYGRVDIKHEEWEMVSELFNGKLVKWIEKVKTGEMKSKNLANALKTAINSVYGLTAASFPNPFRDERNIDNIVAKRGALFMIDLKEAVQAKGYTVVHIKTDSIKIADADDAIIKFVYDFGKKYGYTFEHEATYDKLCIVNQSTYIAKDASDGHWTATGKQFQVPYVFKTLFTHEDIDWETDLTWTFSTRDALYLDLNYNLPDVTDLEKQLKDYERKYKKGELSDTTWESEELFKLRDDISAGHDMFFIGKVGNFIPVNEDAGDKSGVLYRVKDGSNYAPPMSTGFRFYPTELARKTWGDDICNYIDMRFFDTMANEAVDTIRKFAINEENLNWFISDEPYNQTISPFNTMLFK